MSEKLLPDLLKLNPVGGYAARPEHDAPKRFRAGDVIENLQRTIEALTTKTAEPYVSVEFTRNAKGETQISTKVSAPGGTDSDALYALAAEVRAVAEDTYAASTASYPAGSGFVTNDGKGEAK